MIATMVAYKFAKVTFDLHVGQSFSSNSVLFLRNLLIRRATYTQVYMVGLFCYDQLVLEGDAGKCAD